MSLGTASSGRSHAASGAGTRIAKARKIERLLGLEGAGPPLRILEVGTGAGLIAHYFATGTGRGHAVTAIDVLDQRVVRDGFAFLQTTGVDLPFAEGSFDAVISNHVIEHVGERDQQRRHLSELRRVLAPGGTAYLAVPNRWMLVEPHYRLPLLSWWPRSWRSPYLRLFRAVAGYDCEPLAMAELEALLAGAGWRFENVCAEAASVMRDIEPGSLGLAAYHRLPAALKRALLPAMPTLIYRLRQGAPG